MLKMVKARTVKAAFQAERSYLLVATRPRAVDQQPHEAVIEIQQHIYVMDGIREANRSSPLFTHLSAISEGSIALGWVSEKTN